MKNLWAGGGDVDVYGTITSPSHKGVPLNIKRGGRWSGDVGALVNNSTLSVKLVNFSALPDWLGKMQPFRSRCLWIAGCDVLFNAQDTYDAYHEFRPYFRDWPLAYVAQNGSEDLPIPEDAVAVFIAGTTAWKESYEALSVIERAQRLGKKVHIGRINWWDRYRKFAALNGSEEFTFDGNRQVKDGTQSTLEAWQDYSARPPGAAGRQLKLIGVDPY